MLIRAVIFDFDGLILETEVPDFQSWQEIYALYGGSLSLTTWLPFIGTGSSSNTFNAYVHLEAQIGHTLDRNQVRVQRRRRYAELVEAQPILPGVETTIREAKQRGLLLAVASSSSREWVIGHLTNRRLLQYFDCVVCGDEVTHTKPHPDIYQAALTKLGIQADQTFALEDSPNGVLAARKAGICCIAIPGPLTQHLSFEDANFQITSLADIPFQELLNTVLHSY